MDNSYRNRSKLLVILEIQRETARVANLIHTLFFGVVSSIALLLVLGGMELPLFQVSNDFEYQWFVSGGMLIGGVTLDGIPLTTFNPVALIAYLCAAVALLSLLVFLVLNIVSAVRAKPQDPLLLCGKPRRICKAVTGIGATVASLIFLLFEPTYKLTMTAAGHARMTELSENYSFNCTPTTAEIGRAHV